MAQAADPRNVERTTKTYQVTKRVTIEYVWLVEADTAAEAQAYAEDIGEYNAGEKGTFREGKYYVKKVA